MTNGDGTRDTDGEYVAGVDDEALVGAGPDALSLTPAQHERLKDHLHGDLLSDIQYSERRYLVVGKGGDSGPGDRRRMVRDMLDGRRKATAFRLEDFGLTGEELALWAPAFEILCEQATHVVGVLENYDGGHVWELGYLYRSRVRDRLWLLKRVYERREREREQYDNGMAASHLSALEEAASDRVLGWRTEDELRQAVDEIP